MTHQKHFLIIGGTRGIGKTIAQSIAQAGHRVSVVGRRSSKKSLQKIPNTQYWSLDVTREKILNHAIPKIIKKDGKISHLIFCQRYRGTKDDWHGELATSLTATKKIIELISDNFDETSEKSIVIISSIASSLVGLEQPVSYHVAKAGLTQLVRYFAVRLGPSGIRVNSISPSTVLKGESKQFYLHHTQLQHLYKRIIPLGRMGTAENISDAVNFLCSPLSSFVTGQDIVIDGGLSLRSHEDLARSLTSLSQYEK